VRSNSFCRQSSAGFSCRRELYACFLPSRSSTVHCTSSFFNSGRLCGRHFVTHPPLTFPERQRILLSRADPSEHFQVLSEVPSPRAHCLRRGSTLCPSVNFW
jgi:hypothetical protein